MKKTKKNFVKMILIFFLTLSAFSAIYSNVFAFGLPFGGRITMMRYCSCNASYLLTVGPPRGGEFMYGPSSYSYSYGPPSHTGQWLLGKYGPVMACLNPVCDGACCPTGAGMLILFHGSSM